MINFDFRKLFLWKTHKQRSDNILIMKILMFDVEEM